MPLDELRKKIFECTAPGKFPDSKYVCRTIYAVASPTLANLKQWFTSWFPILDSDVSHFYPWFIAGESEEENRNSIRDIVKCAFSAEAAFALMQKGGKIIETINQVVIIADLTEPESTERVKRIYLSLIHI